MHEMVTKRHFRFVEKERKECRMERDCAMELSWCIVEGNCFGRSRLKMMEIQARILHSSNPRPCKLRKILQNTLSKVGAPTSYT
jgi:hypothetical protein